MVAYINWIPVTDKVTENLSLVGQFLHLQYVAAIPWISVTKLQP